MSKLREALELAAVLATESAGAKAHIVADGAMALLRLGSKAKRLAESECNGIERYDAKLRRRIASWTGADQAAADNPGVRALSATSTSTKGWRFALDRPAVMLIDWRDRA